MKKLIFSALALSMIMFSCQKENVKPETIVTSQETESSGTEQLIKKADEPVFILDKKQKVKYSKIVELNHESTHFLFDYNGENLAFSSDEEFLAWCSEDESRAEMAGKLRAGLEEQQWAFEQGIIDDIEATNRYASEKADEADRGQHIILYDNTFYGGSSVYAAPGSPTFFNFNNKAESVRYITPGLGALCSRTWYRGNKFWYFGYPGHGNPTLWVNSMSNDAESNL